MNVHVSRQIFHMRAYNGWVKATQIQELDPRTKGPGRKPDSPLRVLDLACGKGGDLGKWVLHPRGKFRSFIGPSKRGRPNTILHCSILLLSQIRVSNQG